MKNEEIDHLIEALAAGDSNDLEIDGLVEIIRNLQGERTEGAPRGFKILFNAEAYDSAMMCLRHLTGWRVELTVLDGEQYDGYLRGVEGDGTLLFHHHGTMDGDIQEFPWEEIVSIFVY